MSWANALSLALVTLVAGLLTGSFIATPRGLNDCRAANPGYDCEIGWVRAEPFGKDTP